MCRSPKAQPILHAILVMAYARRRPRRLYDSAPPASPRPPPSPTRIRLTSGFMVDMPAVDLVGSKDQRHARHYLQLMGLGLVLGSAGSVTLCSCSVTAAHPCAYSRDLRLIHHSSSLCHGPPAPPPPPPVPEARARLRPWQGQIALPLGRPVGRPARHPRVAPHHRRGERGHHVCAAGRGASSSRDQGPPRGPLAVRRGPHADLMREAITGHQTLS